MPHLAACHRCQGFVADAARPCPHCDAEPPRWRRVARALSIAVIGAVSSMTLMACYGAMPNEPWCNYDDPACRCDYYGECEDACSVDADCLSGEYCNTSSWTCEWSGYCSDDLNCPDTMVCDPTRGTCHPGIDERCESHYDCLLPAERCDFVTGDCAPTVACGVGLLGCEEGTVCDASFGICVPCTGDACGTCSGEVTCAVEPLDCADGSVPAVSLDGCYTGGCLTDATCAAEACAALDETACDAEPTCQPVYGGVNCSNPDGSPCSGGASCTCESFVFLSCIVAG